MDAIDVFFCIFIICFLFDFIAVPILFSANNFHSNGSVENKSIANDSENPQIVIIQNYIIILPNK